MADAIWGIGPYNDVKCVAHEEAKHEDTDHEYSQQRLFSDIERWFYGK
jgi:hypothetical protein